MRKTILTIEDSPALNYVFSTIFRKDFQVFSVKNSSEAFQHLRSGHFDDLMIISIPDEKSDNYKLLTHLASSSIFCDIPKVVIANSNDAGLRNLVRNLGVSLFLSKPFDPVYLAKKVNEIMNEEEARTFIKGGVT